MDKTKRPINRYLATWKPYFTCLREGVEDWLPTSTLLLCTGTGAYKQAEQEAGRITLANAIKSLSIGEYCVFTNLLQHNVQKSQKSEPIFIIMIKERLKEAERLAKLGELIGKPSWHEGSTVLIKHWSFQIFSSIIMIKNIKPNVDFHSRVVRHICLSGIQTDLTRQQALAYVTNIVEPKHIAYIYVRKTKQSQSFILALMEESPDYAETVWDGAFPIESLVASELTVVILSSLPSRDGIEWYKHHKPPDTQKVKRQGALAFGGGRGQGNSGRGAGRRQQQSTYKDALEGGFQFTHLNTIRQQEQKSGQLDQPNPYIHK
jgi:hypothetical protein